MTVKATHEELTSDQELEQCEEHLKQGLNKGKVPKVETRLACIEDLQENQFEWTGVTKSEEWLK